MTRTINDANLQFIFDLIKQIPIFILMSNYYWIIFFRILINFLYFCELNAKRYAKWMKM